MTFHISDLWRWDGAIDRGPYFLAGSALLIHMWPAAYWQVWSDAIIHSIHARVLAHVRGLAEAELNATRDPRPLGGDPTMR
jgi:hypothetical protein